MARRSSPIVLAIALVVVGSLATATGMLVARRGQMIVEGKVVAEGTSVGSFSFAVNECVSGQSLTPAFLGVDLRAEGGYAIRVVGSGDSARIWLYSQGGRRGSIAFAKHNCTQWDVFVERPPSKIDRAKGMAGRLNVACAAGGGSVTANARFARCPD